MNPESLAERLREEIGAGGRFPEPADAWRLAARLEMEIEVRPVPRAYTLRRADGRALITVPAGLAERKGACKLMEEIGHALLDPPRPDPLPDDPHSLRLALLNNDKDEARVRRFLLAWYLPAALLPAYLGRYEALAEDAGVSLPVVNERVMNRLLCA